MLETGRGMGGKGHCRQRAQDLQRSREEKVHPLFLEHKTFPVMGSWGVMRKVMLEGVRGEQRLWALIEDLRVYPQGNTEPQEGF